jgi:hypothetical protein
MLRTGDTVAANQLSSARLTGGLLVAGELDGNLEDDRARRAPAVIWS